MKIKEGFAKRNIAGSDIVVPVGKTIHDFNGMITLEGPASFFWEIFTEDISIEQAVQKVTSEYDIDAQTAKEDIETFVKKLVDAKIME